MTKAAPLEKAGAMEKAAPLEKASDEKRIKNTLGITVRKEEDMPAWYGQVVLKAELADYAPVKGCMVIRPRGYFLWQQIMDYFNGRLAKLGVKNAYFPLFIPESFFRREAEHAKGFTAEVAWIANRDDESKERLAIRPTSETIMYDAYSKWIRSHRDLPLRINQWCNIVRWEVSDVKLFLRSREFLWQEGHCCYETQKECSKETLMILQEYRKLCEELLCVPVVEGLKTERERFAGAIDTYTIESLMPDGKALQLGTSHNLSQGFARAFDISFLGKDEKKHHPWQNSWGFSTRLIGGMVMLHSDDKGLVLPPRMAPVQVVIVPILFDKSRQAVLRGCSALQKALGKEKALSKDRVCLDDREEYSPGFKFNEWELKGVPVRIEIGPKDVDKKQAVLVRRDTGEKKTEKMSNVPKAVKHMLDTMQNDLLSKARKKLRESIVDVRNLDELMKSIKQKKIARAAFSCNSEDEDQLKADTGGVTARVIPLSEVNKVPKEKCFFSGKKARHYVLFGRNY